MCRKLQKKILDQNNNTTNVSLSLFINSLVFGSVGKCLGRKKKTKSVPPGECGTIELEHEDKIGEDTTLSLARLDQQQIVKICEQTNDRRQPHFGNRKIEEKRNNFKSFEKGVEKQIVKM